MKKISVLVAGLVSLLATGCGMMGGNVYNGGTGGSQGGNILGDVIGAIGNAETIGNVLGSVIGLDKLSPAQLYGSWRYDGPGCAFTSSDLLAKAGGEVAATQVEKKLESQYARLGINSRNTVIAFNENGTFSATIGGRSWSGNYTYDPRTSAIRMQGLLLSLNGYVTRNGRGISLLFESKKLLTLLQTVAAFSGNSTISTMGELSKNFDGMRIGFDLR